MLEVAHHNGNDAVVQGKMVCIDAEDLLPPKIACICKNKVHICNAWSIWSSDFAWQWPVLGPTRLCSNMFNMYGLKESVSWYLARHTRSCRQSVRPGCTKAALGPISHGLHTSGIQFSTLSQLSEPMLVLSDWKFAHIINLTAGKIEALILFLSPVIDRLQSTDLHYLTLCKRASRSIAESWDDIERS